MNEQKKLEKMVNSLVENQGLDKAIRIIKSRGIGNFKEYKNYPKGVFIFCTSPEGGLLVGKR